MTAEPKANPGSGTTDVEDVACLGCGCLCDDLRVDANGGAATTCDLGRAWFASLAGLGDVPEACAWGNPVDRAEAVRRAVELLRGARAPVVFGLAGSTVEAVREAIGLAEAIRAKVVIERTPADLGRVSAFQDQGRVSATLGEVRNRADLIVYWGLDPARTHPRHAERYGADSAGRFVRGGREVVMVGRAGGGIPSVQVEPGDEVRALSTLRMRVRRRDFAGEWGDLAGRLTTVRYGALVFQPLADSYERAGAAWEAATRLVRDLNDVTRFVLLGAGKAGNLAGAEAAVTWQGGFLQGVDYRRGFPEPLDPGATLDALLERREVDAVLAVGASERARARGDVPRVAIGPTVDATAEVALASSVTGLDVGGTVVRADGVALPLRPVRGASRPTERDWLRELSAGLAGGAA